MMKQFVHVPVWLLLTLLTVVVGCSSEPRSTETAAPEAAREDASGESAAEEAAASSDKPFVLGDLIEPFDPPPLAELEKSVEWTDSPVVDALARLREAKASEPALVTVDEALAMQNNSKEDNEKIVSALSVLAPPDGKGVNWKATFNRALLMDLSTTNPLLTSSIAESEINSLTSFGLFGFDWNLIPFASKDSVVSWQTSKDHMIDKIVIRDDLVWSDGTPITAHDVAFSFKVIMSSQVPVPAMRTGTDLLRWVEAYDDHTLVYFHKAALATNLFNLNFLVVPKHIFEKSIAEDPSLRNSEYHRGLERNPISGGPYEIERWRRGQEILLKRRESYYMHDGKQVRDKPYFAEMRFRIIEDPNTRILALKSGDIQEAELDAEQWVTQATGNEFYRDNTKASGPEWKYMYIGWNMDARKVPFFTDVRVRKALACALNYDEMLNDLSYGLYTQCLGPWHPESWMFSKNPPPPYHFDLDKAEDLLDEAGWVDSDGDGIRDKEIDGRVVPFEFSLLVSNKPDRIAICNLFRENLESIGVVCNITPLEAAVFQDRVFKKNFEAEMAGWGTGADPSLARNIFGTNEGRNYGMYSNPEVDRLFAEADKTFGREEQAKIYGEIGNLIYADQPYLFLYNVNSFFGFNKQLRGYRFSPRGPFHYSPGISSIWAVEE